MKKKKIKTSSTLPSVQKFFTLYHNGANINLRQTYYQIYLDDFTRYKQDFTRYNLTGFYRISLIIAAKDNALRELVCSISFQSLHNFLPPSACFRCEFSMKKTA